MLSTEELESWNAIFSDCQIRESDLRTPTEAFLTKILTSYLKLLGYKVEAAGGHMDDNSRENRLFRIKLTRHIDHILKISKKTYTFSYFDLIQPTIKKTNHMIPILLNYLYYYNMYTSDCFRMANEHIQKFEHLQESIKKTQEDIEMRKKKDEEMEQEFDELTEREPKLNAEMDEQQTKNKKQKEHIQKLHQSINGLKEQVQSLQPISERLETQIVSDDEARDLQSKLTKIQEEIAEQKRLEIEINNDIEQHNATINAAQELIVAIKEAKNVFPLSLLEDFKTAREKIKAAKANADTLKAERQKLLGLMEKKSQELKQLEQKEKHKKDQYEKEKSHKTEALENKLKQLKGECERLEFLKGEEHAYECLLAEENDIKSFIDENLHELLSPYKRM